MRLLSRCGIKVSQRLQRKRLHSPMLEIRNVSTSLQIPQGSRQLLSGLQAAYPKSHFGAIVGASGSGKSTLLKLIAGVSPGEEEGEIQWCGRKLVERDFHGGEIAFVQQFGHTHLELTVRETVSFARTLRVGNGVDDAAIPSVDELLQEVGLEPQQGQIIKTLSGGQRRRLALAMELTSDPDILLCDEVTSGLDPRSEDGIVKLLQRQAHEARRLVLSVTHSLDHIDHYDSVLVLHQGRQVFFGPPSHLCDYFAVQQPERLYAQLDSLPAEEWAARWDANKPPAANEFTSMPRQEETKRKVLTASWTQQFWALLQRRCLIFIRNKPQLLLQLGLIFGFPLLVAFFAWGGLPPVESLSFGLGSNAEAHARENQSFLIHSSKVGSLVSGLVMFQVVLLTLMGANNSGREIAAERPILEHERLCGLRPAAYLASKVVYLLVLTALQSVWMAVFVHSICGFPGSLLEQALMLFLVNVTITSLCLGVSSLMSSAEQASILSIYVVGFQLPLSGAILALPSWAAPVVQPLVSAYWGWSGVLQTMRADRYYDLVQANAPSTIASTGLCVSLLTIHAGLGLAAAFLGCEHRKWH